MSARLWSSSPIQSHFVPANTPVMYGSFILLYTLSIIISSGNSPDKRMNFVAGIDSRMPIVRNYHQCNVVVTLEFHIGCNTGLSTGMSVPVGVKNSIRALFFQNLPENSCVHLLGGFMLSILTFLIHDNARQFKRNLLSLWKAGSMINGIFHPHE